MAKTYTRPIMGLMIQTKDGEMYEVWDDASLPQFTDATSALSEFKAKKTIHAHTENGEVLIPYHAVKFLVTITEQSDEITINDANCVEDGGGGGDDTMTIYININRLACLEEGQGIDADDVYQFVQSHLDDNMNPQGLTVINNGTEMPYQGYQKGTGWLWENRDEFFWVMENGTLFCGYDD